jgi:hypothetical protein
MSNETLTRLTKAITYSRVFLSSIYTIFAVSTLSLAVIQSETVWTWIHGDEEEDTVRFRQRLTFVLFFSLVFGLLQLRYSNHS